MTDMILLGAGASREADIPTAYEMSIQITKEFEDFASMYPGWYSEEIYRFALFVAGGMLLRQGSLGTNPFHGVNVEELFQAIQLIRDKDKIAISGVITWHPDIEDLCRKKNAQSRGAYEQFFSDLERFFARALINLTEIVDSAKVSYLKPVLRLLSHQNKLVVATLNYDRSFEMMAEAQGQDFTPVINDISVLRNQGLFLLKLHGSIDWKVEDTPYNSDAPYQMRTIRRANPTEMEQKGYSPGIIFGAGNKLTAEGPYLELLRAFHQELASATKLTVVGYSFSDEHINEFIGRWLNAVPEHRLQVVDPGFPQANAFSQFLHRNCSSRITCIPKKASEGLLDAFP